MKQKHPREHQVNPFTQDSGYFQFTTKATGVTEKSPLKESRRRAGTLGLSCSSASHLAASDGDAAGRIPRGKRAPAGQGALVRGNGKVKNSTAWNSVGKHTLYSRLTSSAASKSKSRYTVG